MFNVMRERAITDLVGLERSLAEAFHGIPEVTEVSRVGDDPGTLQLRMGIEDIQVHLDNLAAATLMGGVTAKEQKAAIDAFTRGLVEAYAPRDISLDALKLVVRHQDYTQQGPSLFEPVCGDLVMILMEDTPAALRSVRAEGLAEAGIDQGTAWTRAGENLGQYLNDNFVCEELPGELTWIGTEDGVFGSSLFLSIDGLHNIREGLGYDVMLMALFERDGLVICDGGNEADGAAKLEFFHKSSEYGANPHSDFVFRLAPGDDRPQPWRRFDAGALRPLS